MGIIKPCECSGTLHYHEVLGGEDSFHDLFANICPDCFGESSVTWTDQFMNEGEIVSNTFVSTFVSKPSCILENSTPQIAVSGKGRWIAYNGEQVPMAFTLIFQNNSFVFAPGRSNISRFGTDVNVTINSCAE